MLADIDTPYLIADVRDATRWLNDAIERASSAGHTVSLRIAETQPVRIEVNDLQARAPRKRASERR